MTDQQLAGSSSTLLQEVPEGCEITPGSASEARPASRTSRRMPRRTGSSKTAQGKATAEAVASAVTHEILRARFARRKKSRCEGAKRPIQIVYWRYRERCYD